ncbi:MAG: TIGR02587 family membrane protein [Rhodothermales bacterium]
MDDVRVRPIPETLQEYGRGIVGGLLFALAPLYTMEAWWQGFLIPPKMLLFAVIATVLVVMAYVYYAGIHQERDLTYVVSEAMEAIAIGFLIAFIVLKLVGQLPPSIALGEFIAKLTVEGLASAVGVAVGSAQLGNNPKRAQEADDAPESGLIHEVAYSILGAVLLMLGFAPTEEILLAALGAPVWAPPATVLLSFVLTLGIVHYLDFRGTNHISGDSYAGGPLGDACVTYAVALAVAWVLLWTVGRFDDATFAACLNMTVYLAFPGSIGAAVGRLLL